MLLDFQSIVESSPDGVLIASADGLIVYVNEETERILGYSREELLNQSLESVIPEPSRAVHVGLREQYTAHPVRRPMGKISGITARRRDGVPVAVDVNLSALGNQGVVATIRDVTERVRIEREMRHLTESLEARIGERDRHGAILQSTFDSIADGVIVLDRLGYLQIINPAALRIFPAAAMNGHRMPFAKVAAESGAFLPDKISVCPLGELLVAPVLRGELVNRLELFVRHSVTAEGIWASISARPVRDSSGGITGAVVAIRDTTERKTAQEHLMAAQEDERNRIARELHDSVCQSICSVILEIEKIAVEMPEYAGALRERIDEQKERLVELADEVSSVAHRLHPALLERVGLAEAMERVCREFDAQGLAVDFSQRNIPRMVAASSALCIYRVTQEALRNAMRHGKAASATVTLEREGGMLRLSIADAGIGFDLEVADAKGGLGLVSMRERVRLAGGVVSIRSRPGQGVRIDVTAPVSREPGRHEAQSSGDGFRDRGAL